MTYRPFSSDSGCGVRAAGATGACGPARAWFGSDAAWRRWGVKGRAVSSIPSRRAGRLLTGRLVPFLWALLLVLIPCAQALAQHEATANAVIDIPLLLRIDVSGGDVLFEATEDDLEDGRVPSAVTTVIEHRGNVAHTVQLRADADHLDYEDTLGTGEEPAKPVGDIEWILLGDPFDLQGSLDPEDQELRSAPRGAYVGGNALELNWRARIDYDDPPGRYTVGLVFTIVADS